MHCYCTYKAKRWFLISVCVLYVDPKHASSSWDNSKTRCSSSTNSAVCCFKLPMPLFIQYCIMKVLAYSINLFVNCKVNSNSFSYLCKTFLTIFYPHMCSISCNCISITLSLFLYNRFCSSSTLIHSYCH